MPWRKRVASAKSCWFLELAHMNPPPPNVDPPAPMAVTPLTTVARNHKFSMIWARPLRCFHRDMTVKPFWSSRNFRLAARTVLGITVAALSVTAFSAQDKYALRVPNGLAFSDFRGYENWQVVAVSQTEDLLKVMVANPAMIDAYRAGVPGNGKSFPDGSKIAKIEWKPKKNAEAPFSVRVPDALQDVFFIEKNLKKYPATKGWAYAAFDFDPATGNFKPDPTGTVSCGFACHTGVAAKDYISTAYGTR